MITELIMDHFAWEAVWAPHSGYRAKWRRHCFGSSWFVGTWTGPDRDLICVRDCDTSEEAERWLSPPGRTILHAALRAAWLRLTG